MYIDTLTLAMLAGVIVELIAILPVTTVDGPEETSRVENRIPRDNMASGL